jgi:hypothetical protein
MGVINCRQAGNRRVVLRKYFIVPVICSAFLLNACAVGGGTPLSLEEQRLRQQQNDFNITLGEGVGAGALIGGLIGGLVAGRSGALLGAAAGAAAGGGVGYYFADKKKQYANVEDRISAVTADVQTDNDKLARYIQNVEAVVAQDKARLEELRGNVQTASGQISQINNTLFVTRDDRKVLADTLENLKKKQTEYKAALDDSRGSGNPATVRTFEGQLNILNAQIGKVEAAVTSLDEAMAVSTVG